MQDLSEGRTWNWSCDPSPNQASPRQSLLPKVEAAITYLQNMLLLLKNIQIVALKEASLIVWHCGQNDNLWCTEKMS